MSLLNIALTDRAEPLNAVKITFQTGIPSPFNMVTAFFILKIIAEFNIDLKSEILGKGVSSSGAVEIREMSSNIVTRYVADYGYKKW
jgi:hypothetical protein